MQRSDKRKVKIIALNMAKGHPNLHEFVGKSALEKIDYVVERIKEICEELKILEAESQEDAIWIMGLHEYAISSSNTKFVSEASANYFTTQISTLIKQYPQLVIIGGTIAKTKYFNSFEYQSKRTGKIKNIKDEVLAAYAANMNVNFSENLEQHYEMAVNVLKKNSSGIAVVKNKTHVISKAGVFSRNKTDPFHELNIELNEQGKVPLTNAVFMPGRPNEEDRIITLTFKDGTILRFVLDICLELHNQIDVQAINGPVDFHFVVSNSIDVKLLNIIAKYFVQFDFTFQPRLFQTSDDNSQFDVELYQDNILSPHMYLRGPLQAIYPNELRIINSLKQAAATASSEKVSKKIKRLENLFIRNISPVKNRNTTVLISELWQAFYWLYEMTIKKRLKSKPTSETIFYSGFNIIFRLFKKIKDEILKRLDYDIISKQESQLFIDDQEFTNEDVTILSTTMYVNQLVLLRTELEAACTSLNLNISLDDLIADQIQNHEMRLFSLINRLRLLIHDNIMQIFDICNLKPAEVMLAASVVYVLILRGHFQCEKIPEKNKNWLNIANVVVKSSGLPRDAELALENYIIMNDPQSTYSILLAAMDAPNPPDISNDNHAIEQPTALPPSQTVSAASGPNIQPSVSRSSKCRLS